MADVAVEIQETPVVEKVAVEEVDAGKKEVSADTPAIEEPTTTENGDVSSAEEKKLTEEAKENGNGKAVADEKTETDGAAAEADIPAATEAAAEESAPAKNGANGVEPAVEANGDSTDSVPAEAVKRKVVEGEVKTDDAAEVTPDKKAKLEETSKEEVQNGAEATEVAA